MSNKSRERITCNDCGCISMNLMDRIRHYSFCRECNKEYCLECMYSDIMCFSCSKKVFNKSNKTNCEKSQLITREI